MVASLRYEERRIDTQYRGLLQAIKDNNELVMPQQEEGAYTLMGHQMRFNLANGFPVCTERDLVSAKPGKNSIWKNALGELFAFLAGARTQAHLVSHGVSWWKLWATAEKCGKRGLEPGDLGPGSYGAAWRTFPTSEGEPFDQIVHLLEQIKELPHLRTHFVSPWIPQYIGRGKGKTQKVVVAPCHGWFHVLVNVAEGTLSLHHFQRSADAPVGLVANMVQYAALTMMLAQVTGYRAKNYVHTISDAHIYVSQMKDVDEMLATEPGRLPTVTLDPSVTNLFDFRPVHFTVNDYHPRLPPRVIPTPV